MFLCMHGSHTVVHVVAGPIAAPEGVPAWKIAVATCAGVVGAALVLLMIVAIVRKKRMQSNPSETVLRESLVAPTTTI